MRKRKVLLFLASGTLVLVGILFWVFHSRGLEEPQPLVLLSSTVVHEDDDERVLALHFAYGDVRRVDAYLRRPVNPVAPGSLPAIVLAAGRATGREAAAVIPGPVQAAILAVEYPEAIPSGTGAPGMFRALPGLRRSARAMPGVLRSAGHLLAADPEVDAEQLVLVGVSFGVPFAAAAGRDRVFRGVALHFGGGDLGMLLRANLEVEPGLLRSAIARFGAWYFRDLEPRRHVGHIAPTPLLVINGERDATIPVGAARRLVERAKPPYHVVWLPHEHIHSRNLEALREVADSTFVHFGLRLPAAAVIR
jgi:fermentation-respiration switch protein FrsA (DUF1100 family)